MEEKDRISRAVSTALDRDVHVRPAAAEKTYWLNVAGLRRVRFRATWARRGTPKDLTTLLADRPSVTLVVAPALSTGARRLLDERKINWVDETGAASMRAEGLLVRVDTATAPVTTRPSGASWSRTAVLAGEAVLAHRPEQLTTLWIAEHAHCSVARASRILAGWDAEGWTQKQGPARGRGAHRTLERVDVFLTSWTAHVNATPVDRWFAHTTDRDLHRVEQRVAEALDGVAFGWTGWAAAQQLAPILTQLPVLHLRINERHTPRELEPRLREAGLTMTADAGRVELWRTATDALRLATPTPSGPVVSWPRVYADLERLSGRGHDAAQHLRDVMESAR